jgi:hypothetical protein
MADALVSAVLDANVLYPQFLRDVLLRLAIGGTYAPLWSDRIQDEWTRSLLRDRPDLSPDAVARTRRLMDVAFPQASVRPRSDLSHLFPAVDAKDRHVAAIAAAGGATVIVTRNLKHFPSVALAAHGITARDPDDFVADLLERDAVTVQPILEAHRRGLRNPPFSTAEYREAFVRTGLVRSAGYLP